MRNALFLIFCLLIFSSVLTAQEVVITGFPIGVGRSIDKDFIRPYHDELKGIADTLAKYPLVEAIITGGADGETYRAGDNTKNPALALGRAHVLRNYLTSEFNVNPEQIQVNSEEVTFKGPEGRYVSVRISREKMDEVKALAKDDRVDDLLVRIDQLENRPPVVEKHLTTEVPIVEDGFADYFGVTIGAGFTTSPFGGIPIVSGGVTWQRKIFFEALAGYTFWSNDFEHPLLSTTTKRRMLGGKVIYFPFDEHNIGLVGGWFRVEQIAHDYLEYVKMSEGPLFGIRYVPTDWLHITGAYNPSNERHALDNETSSKNGQFMLSVSVYSIFGGER